MEGNGGCCIARWSDGGHVAGGYDATKMDRIMLKFRPIAPKPVAGNGAVVATSDSSNGSPRGSSHAKGSGRGRRKSTVNKENNNNNNDNNNNNGKIINGRKRKSTSPQDQRVEKGCQGVDHHHDDQSKGGEGVTLLPLFPEAPDLSPTKAAQQEGNTNMKMPMWLDFNTNTPVFVDNYIPCHGQGW